MSGSRLNLAELAGALIIVLFGIFVVWRGLDYPIGTFRRLGAGALPVALGTVMITFGVVIALQNLSFERVGKTVSLRVLGSVIGALVVWTITVPYVGFFVGTILLVTLSSLADGRFSLIRTGFLSFGVAMLGLIIFVYGLRIPLPRGPW